MPLLNYTTKIDPDKTAMEITRILSSHGAKAVLTEYDNETNSVSSLSFKIDVNGSEVAFRLPCNWRPVFAILEKDPKVPRANSDKFQAVRTSWRIVKDWVEAQMALVETEMVSTQDVFLPYAITKSGETLAEVVNKNPQFLLGKDEHRK